MFTTQNIAFALIAAALTYIFCKCRPGREKRKPFILLSFNFHHQSIAFTGKNIMAKIRESQAPFTVRASVKKANGQPGRIQTGTARWESSDPSVATVEVNPENELEATITPGTNVNNATQILFTGDADLDEGDDQVRELQASGTLELLEDEAVVADLEFVGITAEA